MIGDLRVEGGDDADALEEDDAVLGEEGGELVLLVKVQLGVGAGGVVRAAGVAHLDGLLERGLRPLGHVRLEELVLGDLGVPGGGYSVVA